MQTQKKNTYLGNVYQIFEFCRHFYWAAQSSAVLQMIGQVSMLQVFHRVFQLFVSIIGFCENIQVYSSLQIRCLLLFLKCVISSPNPIFDSLLESSNQDDSNKLSNIGFGEEKYAIKSRLKYLTHVTWISVIQYTI